jgi:hypothetical protein
MVVIETLVDHRVRRGKKKGDTADKSGDVVEYLVQYSKAEGQAKGDKVINKSTLCIEDTITINT